jgi:hypothetical protein
MISPLTSKFCTKMSSVFVVWTIRKIVYYKFIGTSLEDHFLLLTQFKFGCLLGEYV